MGDRAAPKGSEAWCRWLHFELLKLLDDQEQLGDRLQVHVSAFEDTTAYQKLSDRHGRPFIDFADYCQTPPPYGLGRLPAVVHAEAEIRLREGRGRPSKDEKDNNVMISPKRQGNDRSYLLARLKRDRPELAARVEAGQLSANAAAIEAGFRKPTLTVQLTIDGVLRAFLRLTGPERERVDGAIHAGCRTEAELDREIEHHLVMERAEQEES
jgi:hypothetical protein